MKKFTEIIYFVIYTILHERVFFIYILWNDLVNGLKVFQCFRPSRMDPVESFFVS